jgi:hypothetical protein
VVRLEAPCLTRTARGVHITLTGSAGSSAADADADADANANANANGCVRGRMQTQTEGSGRDDRPLEDGVARLAHGMRQAATLAVRSG